MISKENLKEGKFIGSFVNTEDMPTDLSQVAFLGRSNSGKSTLLSAFLRNSSVVSTSSRPGSTVTVNFFLLGKNYLVDLPGYGYARRSHREKGVLTKIITGYLDNSPYLKAGILTHDCNRKLLKEEIYLAELFREHRVPLILALTKTDRLNQKEKYALEKQKKEYEEMFHHVALVSAKKRTGLEYFYTFLQSI